jgi:hypothetical protein
MKRNAEIGLSTKSSTLMMSIPASRLRAPVKNVPALVVQKK